MCWNGSQRCMEGLEGACKSWSLSCLRIVILLFRAVTERFKVKTFLNVKDFQKALATVNYELLNK